MAKKKFYGVAVGRTTGVFTDWSTAEKQVKGFGGAKYKSFPTRELAEAWIKDPVYSTKPQQEKTKDKVVANGSVPDDTIVVYTDGGAINNPGPGGYGVVIQDGSHSQELSGGFRLTTNNRMELVAVIVALNEVAGSNKQVWLYSDSSYVVNGISKGWARNWRRKGWRKSDGTKPLNIDLWQELLDLDDKVSVRYHWVKGHAGNPLNERCDQLAVTAARAEPTTPDDEYEKLKENCSQ